ncbi:MAG: glycosyltransferase family 2 protein [Candidatus Latescibacterota bacterium]|nr:MAG: glycosyltransferase family 2 protein [Candidatus Latescibacterota bacterium]
MLVWQFVFWSSLAVVLYSYIGYPLILFLIRKLKRRDRHVYDADYCPSVCLLISAYNEERVIRKKIENSLSLDYPKERYTILVASDGSDDHTVAITEDYQDLGIKLYHRRNRSGKSAVLNDVMKSIGADIVVFTDANSLFAEDALRKIVARFQNPKIGCVVGKLRYVDRHTSSVSKGEGLYWKYEGKLSVLESSLESVLVANGSIFGIRRELFTKLCPEVANDFQIPIEIGSRGYGVVYEPEAVAFETSTVFWQEEFHRKVRIIVRGLTGYSMLRKKLRGFRAWQFFSHKLLRWVIGPLLFLILLSNAMLLEGSSFYALTLGLQLALYLAALNGWRVRRTRKPHPLFYVPFYFTMVNLAAVVAIAKFLSGERQSTWVKAESARFTPARAPEGGVVSELKPIASNEASLQKTDPIESADVAEKVAKN